MTTCTPRAVARAAWENRFLSACQAQAMGAFLRYIVWPNLAGGGLQLPNSERTAADSFCPEQALDSGPPGSAGHPEQAMVLLLPGAAHAGHLQPLVPDVCHSCSRSSHAQGSLPPLWQHAPPVPVLPLRLSWWRVWSTHSKSLITASRLQRASTMLMRHAQAVSCEPGAIWALMVCSSAAGRVHQKLHWADLGVIAGLQDTESHSSIVRFYYQHRLFMGFCCICCEVLYLSLYLLHFPDFQTWPAVSLHLPPSLRQHLPGQLPDPTSCWHLNSTPSYSGRQVVCHRVLSFHCQYVQGETRGRKGYRWHL